MYPMKCMYYREFHHGRINQRKVLQSQILVLLLFVVILLVVVQIVELKLLVESEKQGDRLSKKMKEAVKHMSCMSYYMRKL